VKVLPAQFTLKQVFIITLIVILWGLDPVFARQILTGYPISAYDLTAIRFLTLFFTATIGYGIQSLLARKTYKPLSPRPTLFLSAAALFLTAISTYVALSLIPPTQYILFVIGGVVLSELIRHRAERTTRWWRLLIALCATIVSLGFLVSTQGHSLTGLLFAALSSFGFALYSRMSGSYQRGVFHARYPAFLFWLSVLCMPFVFLLLPVTDLRTITFSSVLIAIGFVGVFSILPYGIYYEGMRRFSAGMLDNALPFVLFSTVVGEALSTRFWTPLAIIPLLLVFLWHYASVGREAV
jgi:drug/metabolite transporter (DMT)-like permease